MGRYEPSIEACSCEWRSFAAAWNRIVHSLVRTCKVGNSGKARKKPLTAEECTYYLPNEKDVPKERRGNAFKRKRDKTKGDARVRAQRETMQSERKERGKLQELGDARGAPDSSAAFADVCVPTPSGPETVHLS